jgi:hypothetical protein
MAICLSKYGNATVAHSPGSLDNLLFDFVGDGGSLAGARNRIEI